MEYETIKQAIARQYYRWRRVIPKKLLYHPDHFSVRALLDDQAEVRDHIANVRLRHILSIAVAHVPFYRNTVRIPARDLALAPLAELLERFPYIDKETVMAQQAAFLNERVDRRFLRYATSHGSTGTGIGVWRSKRESDIEKASYCHAWGRLGFDFDTSSYLRIGYDAVQPLDAAPTWRQGNRLMLSPDHVQPQHLDRILHAIRRFAPRYIHAYPSAALALAELLAQGGHAVDWPLRGVLLAGPRRYWGTAMEFDCIEVPDIPAAPGGKRRFVVNELPVAPL